MPCCNHAWESVTVIIIDFWIKLRSHQVLKWKDQRMANARGDKCQKATV